MKQLALSDVAQYEIVALAVVGVGTVLVIGYIRLNKLLVESRLANKKLADEYDGTWWGQRFQEQEERMRVYDAKMVVKLDDLSARLELVHEAHMDCEKNLAKREGDYIHLQIPCEDQGGQLAHAAQDCCQGMEGRTGVEETRHDATGGYCSVSDAEKFAVVGASVLVGAIVAMIVPRIARAFRTRGNDQRFMEENKIRHDELMRIADEEKVSEDTKPITNMKVFTPKRQPPEGPPRDPP